MAITAVLSLVLDQYRLFFFFFNGKEKERSSHRRMIHPGNTYFVFTGQHLALQWKHRKGEPVPTRNSESGKPLPC